MEDKIIISIEGNIGVGKTTFIKILNDKFGDCEIVNEPLDEWNKLTDLDGKNILQKFYEDKKRWGYSFQNIACISRMTNIENTLRTSNKKHIFIDRSLGTDSNVFEKMLYDKGDISELEHKMYKFWYNFYEKYVRINSNIIYIYLQCDPLICYDRIKKRNRKEELSIDLNYLQELNKYHDNWLLNNNLENILIINCNNDFENCTHSQNIMINCIKNKILNIKN